MINARLKDLRKHGETRKASTELPPFQAGFGWLSFPGYDTT
jgi:hypothetical protein